MVNFRNCYQLQNKQTFFYKNNTNIILEEYNLELELKNHMIRVSKYAEILANFILINDKKVKLIKIGALLHDIGKILIDENILNKPSKLNTIEFEIMKKHSELGLKILKNTSRDSTIENIILCHHEKWNGKGYPLGLKTTAIPIEARIVAIVDCYDALTSNRVYKNKLSHKEALEILKSECGESFDPNIVFVFESFEEEFKKIMERYNENQI